MYTVDAAAAVAGVCFDYVHGIPSTEFFGRRHFRNQFALGHVLSRVGKCKRLPRGLFNSGRPVDEATPGFPLLKLSQIIIRKGEVASVKDQVELVSMTKLMPCVAWI